MLDVMSPMKSNSEVDPNNTAVDNSEKNEASGSPNPVTEATKPSSTEPKETDAQKKETEATMQNPPPKSPTKTIPGLPDTNLVDSKNSKKKKKKKGQAKTDICTGGQYSAADFLIQDKADQDGLNGFTFSNVDADSSDGEGKGFFHTSPQDVETDKFTNFLTPKSFKSRSAKTIQKEELWNLSIHRAGNTLKRSFEETSLEQRRIRSRSICLS